MTRETTLAEVQDKALIPVWSDHKPNWAGFVGIGRAAAYRAATFGEVPTMRIGGRVFVPVPALLDSLHERHTVES